MDKYFFKSFSLNSQRFVKFVVDKNVYMVNIGLWVYGFVKQKLLKYE